MVKNAAIPIFAQESHYPIGSTCRLHVITNQLVFIYVLGVYIWSMRVLAGVQRDNWGVQNPAISGSRNYKHVLN